MANSKQLDDISMSMTTLAKWFQENLFNPIGFMQLAAVAASYLIAWLLAAKIRQYLEKDLGKVKAHMRFVLSPVHFAIVLKHFFWLLLVWFCQILSRKPIPQGDVVAFEKSFAGAGWGWVKDIGLMYVKVATRDGVLMLIPNEVFVTQKIENLSFDNDNVRLHIPFGISYDSDLKRAVTLAETAAMSIDRVLKIPQPKCRIGEFGESTVNLELRVWINDPKNGFGSVKDAVLLGVWDSFHANGIEIAFPQRDLHIKSVVPLQISGDNPHPVE